MRNSFVNAWPLAVLAGWQTRGFSKPTGQSRDSPNGKWRQILSQEPCKCQAVLFRECRSNKSHPAFDEGKVICQIDGLELCRLECWCCLWCCLMVTSRAHFCEIDGWVLWGSYLGMLFGLMVRAFLLWGACAGAVLGCFLGELFWDAIWGVAEAAGDSMGVCCKIDDQVLFGVLFGGVLIEVLACNHRRVCRFLGSMLVKCVYIYIYALCIYIYISL